MNWTPRLPKDSGYYWYRADAYVAPRVVEWNSEDGTVEFAGNVLWAFIVAGQPADEIGEFWPERILPPTT